MQYANVDGEKVLATKGARGCCPHCGDEAIAKVGRIVRAHWAHRANDCDPWHEAETAWHLDWKSQFPKHQVEVSMGEHRADVKTSKCVIEFQNSRIPPETIRKREHFYGNMVWVVNAKFASRLFLLKYKGNDEFTFRWNNMAKSWLAASCPIFFDLGASNVRMIRGATWQQGSDYGMGKVQICPVHRTI